MPAAQLSLPVKRLSLRRPSMLNCASSSASSEISCAIAGGTAISTCSPTMPRWTPIQSRHCPRAPLCHAMRSPSARKTHSPAASA
eukprot:5333076-Alexandrium_andersonii.AAC.1